MCRPLPFGQTLLSGALITGGSVPVEADVSCGLFFPMHSAKAGSAVSDSVKNGKRSENFGHIGMLLS